MKYLIGCFLLGLSTTGLNAQKTFSSLLQSGPMAGYSTMREVVIWVQTTQPASVYIEYWEKDSVKNRFKSETIQTQALYANTGKIVVYPLEPGKKYEYELFINGKKHIRPYAFTFQTQPLWQYRTDPPPFSFAAGSCAFINEEKYDRPGKGYGDEYFIFDSIARRKPDFMLWLGDNIYLREPDWDSFNGILYRYTHTRSIPEMQSLLATTHHYAIWDDHDYGPNNADRSFWNKQASYEAFQLFWANPTTNATGEGGITGKFSWNDCDFFLLDNRWFRAPENLREGNKEILGKKQIDWLIDALAFSRAPFKFVCVGTQFISSVPDKENFAIYPEREEIIRRIRANKIEGVIFLTGDRHFSEISVFKEFSKYYPLYDFTISPLTSGIYEVATEGNIYRENGTFVAERAFGWFEVSGKRKERVLTVSLINSKGEIKWKKEIRETELKYEK
ncbi:MAG: alkaline phosphatase family protein [Cytophagales bacterium]|nr:alkaline phosphatase family protein [Cytophagales bacterium]MDW8384158.1 alkaline phosphatase D family protein [Flammeovirgaceae bacterium]